MTTEHWRNLSLDNIKGERWKKINWIPAITNDYWISNFGRVKTKPPQRINVLTNGFSQPTLKILKQHKTFNGYLKVILFSNRKSVTKTVHTLVAKGFVSNRQNKPFVCHKDDIKTNNHFENLFWGTHKDNMEDLVSKGKQLKGSEIGVSKLNEAKVLKIKNLLKSKTFNQKEIAAKFKIGELAISRIKNGKSWKHVL